jgi:hypothetical protein
MNKTICDIERKQLVVVIPGKNLIVHPIMISISVIVREYLQRLCHLVLSKLMKLNVVEFWMVIGHVFKMYYEFVRLNSLHHQPEAMESCICP